MGVSCSSVQYIFREAALRTGKSISAAFSHAIVEHRARFRMYCAYSLYPTYSTNVNGLSRGIQSSDSCC